MKRTIKQFLRRENFPRIVEVRDLHPDGVRFEVSNPVEAYRTENHGGETAFTKTMLRSLRPDDTLYDIGACIGFVSLHAARTCKVIAFEPDPGFRKRFQLNARLNGRQVDVLPYAISDSDTTLTLHTDGITGNSPSLRRQREDQNTVEVAARSIDSLISEGLDDPTVMKIDIEGAEILALKGANNLLSHNPPRFIFIEVHPEFLPAFDSSAEEVMSLLTGYGYRPVEHQARNKQEHLILGIG